jgi:hypothetical protein
MQREEARTREEEKSGSLAWRLTEKELAAAGKKRDSGSEGFSSPR